MYNSGGPRSARLAPNTESGGGGVVSGEGSIARWLVWVWVASHLCLPVQAIELRNDMLLLGQVRDGDKSREQESPVDFYGDQGISGLRHGTTLDTYYRLSHDFGSGQGPTEFYAGYMHVPGAVPGVDFTLGRQFLSETPGGVFVADAGKVRFDPGGPVSFTIFGGAPRYFEPTFSSPSESQDEIIFGGNIRTTHMKNGYLTLGFLEQERDERVLKQLVTAAGARSFLTLPGLPNLYGVFSFDADHQNIDQGTAGLDVFLSQPRLLLNLESSYYKPQDNGKVLITNINRREDAVFQVFSLSQELQFRGGLRYTLTRALAAYGDYSYQRYNKQENISENGHIGKVGLSWQPGGDGLELVGVEYYVADSSGGNLNGGRAYYVNRVYDRIQFRTKIDVAYYRKESNQNDTAVASLLGLGYVFVPGLFCEVYMEANRNQRFNEDFRFGFAVTYNGRYRTDKPAPTGEAS